MKANTEIALTGLAPGAASSASRWSGRSEKTPSQSAEVWWELVRTAQSEPSPLHHHGYTLPLCSPRACGRRKHEMWCTHSANTWSDGRMLDSLQCHGWESDRESSCQLTAEGVARKKHRLQVFTGRMLHGKVIHYIWEHWPVAHTIHAHMKPTCQFKWGELTNQRKPDGIILTGLGQVEAMWMIHEQYIHFWHWLNVTGAWEGVQTSCPSWELTHQGSKNTVATLNPITTHMTMKTGKLLGTQATITAAGMKSWERQKQADQDRFKTILLWRHFRFLTDNPMKTVAFFPILKRTICQRGTAIEAETWGDTDILDFKFKLYLVTFMYMSFKRI